MPTEKTSIFTGAIIFIFFIGSTIVACGSEDSTSQGSSPQLSTSRTVDLSDFTYLGYFSPPNDPDYRNGMNGMTYDPTCTGLTDPSPDDDFPGCIVTQARTGSHLMGVMDIVPNGRATEVRGVFDATGGIYDAFKQDPANRVTDILMLDSKTAITVCIQDWYNTSRVDHDSHCVSTFNSDGSVTADGPFNFAGVHALSVAGYVGKIPTPWSEAFLGSGDWCFTGFKRNGGGLTPDGSAGPTQFAFQCDANALDTLNTQGEVTGAIKLMKYDHAKPITSYDGNDIKDWTVGDDCNDAVWLDETTFAVSCIKGGKYWWYGDANPWKGGAPIHRNGYGWINPGNPKTDKAGFLEFGPALPNGISNVCAPGKGYNAVDENGHRGLELWVFSGKEIGEVAKGTRLANSIQPDRLQPPGLISPIGCNRAGGLAWDDAHRLLYWVEKEGTNTYIHIYRIADTRS